MDVLTMIIEFRVQNHRSFRSEQTLNLAASNYDKSLPENLITQLPGLPDLRLVKAVALYGPNAGGKTNVLLALKFLRWLVVESATGQKPEAKIPTEPFRLDAESINQPTVLELTFVAEGVRYELAVAVTKDRVVQERLVAYPNGRAQIWFDRVWNEEKKRYDWSPEKPTDFERDPGIVEKTRENALFISTAAQWNNAQLTPVYKWFTEKLFIFGHGFESPRFHEITAKLINKSDKARGFMTNLLRRADLGLAGVEAKEQSIDSDLQKRFTAMKNLMDEELAARPNVFPESIWDITFQHEGKDGQHFALDWNKESAGTQRFFTILGPLIGLASSGAVMCVDELDSSLHPTLAAELLRLFFMIPNATTPAQLLFTTHNPLLLDMTLLRRDQVWFADKKQDGESFLYPLTEYKPRADESLERGYLSGRYGAVPFIPNGLVGDKESLNQVNLEKETADAR